MTISTSFDAAPIQPLELKGTTLPVTAIMVGMADPAHLQLALAGKLGEAPGFFDGELAVLDLSRLPADAADSIQLDRLIALLRQAGMIPVAARGLSASLAAVAEALGLAVLPASAPPAAPVRPVAPPASAPPVRPAAEAADRSGAADHPGPERPAPDRPPIDWSAASAAAESAAQARRGGGGGQRGARAGASAARPSTPELDATAAFAAQGADRQPVGAQAAGALAAGMQAAAPQPADEAPATVTALVIERTLRSGQRIYARGRDLVLMAGVSPGAEVIADGSIHCYGRLRGRALAGASGNAAARIFAQDFQAELVSIAGVWRTFEPSDPQIRGGEPVRVALRDDGTTQAIAIEPIAAE